MFERWQNEPDEHTGAASRMSFNVDLSADLHRSFSETAKAEVAWLGMRQKVWVKTLAVIIDDQV